MSMPKELHYDAMLNDDIVSLGASKAFAPFADSTLLVTGSTGLIGSLMVRGALEWNKAHDRKINVVALARNAQKAAAVFSDYEADGCFRIEIGDVSHPIQIRGPIDWISHGASITSSAAFARTPVEVALTEIDGTRNVLEFARRESVKGVVYLSSLEVYGDIAQDHGEVFEGDSGHLDGLKPRNSYPSSKRMCESLCAAYASEYGVPTKIARLAQTFGAGADPNDGRVFAYFARQVIAGEDIVMRTPGEGCRCYCYTTDAVEGLLHVLSAGEAGCAYNVANPETYCSARDMAEMVAQRFGGGRTSVRFDFPEDVSSYGFASPSFVRMNADALNGLGWHARYGLPEMYGRLIESMKSAQSVKDATE